MEKWSFEHPTIRRLTSLCRHQLSPIARLKCTAKRDGAAVYVNLENAVSVYWSERDKGTIIAFVGGEKDAVTVQEKPEQIIKDR